MKRIIATLGLQLFAVLPAGAENGWIERRYAPTEALIANPERGLYVELADRRQRPLDADDLQELTEDGITLVQRLYYLKSYRERPLDTVQLDLIATDFVTLREAGMKAILRFAYSSKIGEPDAALEVVLGHIEQLGPLLRENSDLILTVQAGFIGAWGEWHASTNGLTEPAAMKQIAAALLNTLPASRTIQVRTPLQKQRLVGSTEALSPATFRSGSLAARIGHHNDCFLADATDVGTYQERRLEADRAYVAADSLLTPAGGETCRNGSRSDPEFAREELARMHWSFLNLAYHRGVIAKWRQSGFLDEVRRQLGYRLRLVKVRLPEHAVAGRRLTGTLVVANDGWAAPIHDRPIEFALASPDGKVAWRSVIPADLRRTLPGSQSEWNLDVEVPSDLKPGAYAAWLRLPDPSPRLHADPRYGMRLANADLTWTREGSNDLGVQVSITKNATPDTP